MDNFFSLFYFLLLFVFLRDRSIHAACDRKAQQKKTLFLYINPSLIALTRFKILPPLPFCYVVLSSYVLFCSYETHLLLLAFIFNYILGGSFLQL